MDPMIVNKTTYFSSTRCGSLAASSCPCNSVLKSKARFDATETIVDLLIHDSLLYK